MIQTLALLAAIGAVVALGAVETRLSAADSLAAAALIAQAEPEASPPAAASGALLAQAQNPPGLGDQKQVEGKIQRVDAGGQSLVLEDGITLTLPDSLAINRSELKPGVVIKAQYEEREGGKMATTISVSPASPQQRGR